MARISPNIALAILLLLVMYGCGLSSQARHDRYLASGKAYLAKRDHARAILEFKNAIAVRPNDADSYYELGAAYIGDADFSSALACFRKTLTLNPNHADAQLKIAEMMVASKNEKLVKEAQIQLKALLERKSSPEVLNTLGFAELSLGNAEGAVQSFERSLADSPGELTASIMLARVNLLKKDFKGAEDILKNACNDAPRSSDAARFLGEFYIDRARMLEADAQLRHALELDPKNGAALMDLARLELTVGQKLQAERSFQRLATFPDYRSVYAIYLFQDGRRDIAVREFERLVRQDKNDRQARTNLVVAYRALKRFADADQLLAAALKKNPKDTEALLQRAETSLEAARYEDAEADLNQVLHMMPTSPEVHYLLAKVSEARGALLTYRQELSEALRLNPSLLPVRLELARNLINSNAPQTAIEIVDSAPSAQRSSEALLIQRNWALWAIGDLAELRRGIDQGLSYEKSSDLLIQDGLWKLQANDPQGARAALEQALKIDPTDIRALQVLNETYKAEKHGPIPLQKVKEYAAAYPSSAPVQDFLGVMLMSQGDRTQARAAFVAAKQADPKFLQADLSLVQIDVADGKLDNARKRLETVLSTSQGNVTAHLWLGNIDEMVGNHDRALEQFRAVVDASPANAQAANNFAYLLAEYRNNTDEALKYAEKAVELVPERGSYSDTLGWILYRKGLYGPAVKYLERANSKQPTAIWKYHLAMAYAKTGDLARARVTLADALRANPNVPEAKIAAQAVAGAH